MRPLRQVWIWELAKNISKNGKSDEHKRLLSSRVKIAFVDVGWLVRSRARSVSQAVKVVDGFGQIFRVDKLWSRNRSIIFRSSPAQARVRHPINTFISTLCFKEQPPLLPGRCRLLLSQTQSDFNNFRQTYSRRMLA